MDTLAESLYTAFKAHLACLRENDIVDVEYEDLSDELLTENQTDEKDIKNDLPLLLPE